MDWYEIGYLYPKSYKKFVETMFPNIGIISVSILKYFDLKKLYQFFDNEGIYLNIEMITLNNWTYTINVNGNMITSSDLYYRFTREEIENDGFYECFKILDKKINYKNNQVQNEL